MEQHAGDDPVVDIALEVPTITLDGPAAVRRVARAISAAADRYEQLMRRRR